MGELEVSSIQLSPVADIRSLFFLRLKIYSPSGPILIKALIDTGAMGSFLHSKFISSHGLKTRLLPLPVACVAYDGSTGKDFVRSVWNGSGAFHSEDVVSGSLNFDVLVSDIGQYDAIIGMPWLSANNAKISCGLEGRGIELGSISLVSSDPYSFDPVETIPISTKALKHSQHPHIPMVDEKSLKAFSERQSLENRIPAVFHEFLDVFQAQECPLPPIRELDVKIDLIPGSEPPRSRGYDLSDNDEKEMSVWIKDQLAKGFVRQSSSPASAPSFLAKSVGRKNCPCVDYRGLNKITIKDCYPIPLVKSLLHQLRGSKRYSKIDLKTAFNLLRIAEKDVCKTAFRAPGGLYESLVLPFGLANGPAVFQRFIQSVLHEYLGLFCIFG